MMGHSGLQRFPRADPVRGGESALRFARLEYGSSTVAWMIPRPAAPSGMFGRIAALLAGPRQATVSANGPAVRLRAIRPTDVPVTAGPDPAPAAVGTYPGLPFRAKPVGYTLAQAHPTEREDPASPCAP